MIEIALTINPTGGSIVYLDDDFSSLQLLETSNPDPAYACKQAAERLRQMAARFELLAQEPQPYKEATHKKINFVEVFRDDFC